jgi:hypothetical protein
MAIKYREHIDADGVHREWTNEHGVVQRELMTPSAEFIEAHQPSWERWAECRAERAGYRVSTKTEGSPSRLSRA